jgi:hypothetical protein
MSLVALQPVLVDVEMPWDVSGAVAGTMQI